MFPFFISDFSNLNLFFLVSVAEVSSILLIFSKKQFLPLLRISIFISPLILILSFLCLFWVDFAVVPVS